MTHENPNQIDEQAQIDYDLDLWEMEQQWRRSLPRHSDVEWLHIFPEAVRKWGPVIRRRMVAERGLLIIHLSEIKARTVYDLQTNKYPWRDDLIKEFGRREIARLSKEIRAIDGRLSFLRSMSRKKVDGIEKKVRITEDMIALAKEYPIDQLIEMNPRTKFAKCIWHNDSKPSMYCKNNFAHCYACGRNGDTIAIVMEREGLSFREAVLRLQP